MAKIPFGKHCMELWQMLNLSMSLANSIRYDKIILTKFESVKYFVILQIQQFLRKAKNLQKSDPVSDMQC